MPKYEIGFWWGGNRGFDHLKIEGETLEGVKPVVQQELGRWPPPVEPLTLFQDGKPLPISEIKHERKSVS
jgi:hypothetical protein